MRALLDWTDDCPVECTMSGGLVSGLDRTGGKERDKIRHSKVKRLCSSESQRIWNKSTTWSCLCRGSHYSTAADWPGEEWQKGEQGELRYFLKVDDLCQYTHKLFLWVGSAQHAWLITWSALLPPKRRCWIFLDRISREIPSSSINFQFAMD